MKISSLAEFDDTKAQLIGPSAANRPSTIDNDMNTRIVPLGNAPSIIAIAFAFIEMFDLKEGCFFWLRGRGIWGEDCEKLESEVLDLLAERIGDRLITKSKSDVVLFFEREDSSYLALCIVHSHLLGWDVWLKAKKDGKVIIMSHDGYFLLKSSKEEQPKIDFLQNLNVKIEVPK